MFFCILSQHFFSGVQKMSDPLKKVFWSEGLLLTQHHLQQWDQYWQQHCGRILPKNLCGLRKLVVDDVALLEGKFKVLQCEVLFENGSYISYQQGMGRELVCEINQPGEKIYIMLSKKNKAEKIEQCLAKHNSGFVVYKEQCEDIYMSSEKKEVFFVEDVIEVYASDRPKKDGISLPIASYECTQSRIYQHDWLFVPVTVYLSSAISVESFLKKITEKLGFYIDAIESKGLVCWPKNEGPPVVLNDLYNDFVRFFLKSKKMVSLKESYFLSDVYYHISLFFSYLSFFVKERDVFDGVYDHLLCGSCFKRLIIDGVNFLESIKIKEKNKVFLKKKNNYYRFSLKDFHEEHFRLLMVVDCQGAGLVDGLSVAHHIKVARESKMQSILSSSLSGFNLVPVLKKTNKISDSKKISFEVVVNEGEKSDDALLGEEFFLIYVSSAATGAKINLFLEKRQAA